MPLPSSRLPTLWWRSTRPRPTACTAALTIFALAAGLACGGAKAEGGPACEKFSWSVERELKLFGNPYLEMVVSGATLASIPEKGLVIDLQPHFTVDYVLAPGGERKSDETFAGLLFIRNVPGAGVYQVTVSRDAWVDLIQDGKALELSAEALDPSCEDARKSLRFRLEGGPATVQVSGVSTNRIKLAILPLE